MAFARGTAIAGLIACASAGAARADEPGAAAALLPDDLTPWGMFVSADNVVKAVMILLILASFVSWTVALAKGLGLLAINRRLRKQIRALGDCASLSEAAERLRGRNGLEHEVLAAQSEVVASVNLDAGGVRERIALSLERLEAEVGRRLNRATGVLATTGATAPFIGLFGTVWGVMNSFIGISRHHTTNLAVIAPGLAEALLTTALGLAAAIPAVVLYNMLARAVAGCRARHADGAAAILRLAGRDLDRACAAIGKTAGFPRKAAE